MLPQAEGSPHAHFRRVNRLPVSQSSSTFRGSSIMGAIGLAALLWRAGRSFLGLPNDPDHALFVLCCFGFAGVAEPIERIAVQLGATAYVGLRREAGPPTP